MAPEEKLDPEDKAELEEETAAYHGCAASLPSRPTPYDLPAPIKMPPPKPDNPLLKQKASLQAQLQHLKEIQ